MINLIDYAPLLQHVQLKRGQVAKFINQEPSKWPTVVRILPHTILRDNVSQKDLDELQLRCSKDIFVPQSGFGNTQSSFASLALLLKIVLIQKQGQQELRVSKILLFFLDVMMDRETPLISLEKLAQVMNIVLETLRQELSAMVGERQVLNVISELMDVISVFCQSSGLTNMNRNNLLPQLAQLHRKQPASLPTEESKQAEQPFLYLFKNTRHTTLFEDMLCGLIQIEASQYQQLRNMSYEATAGYKFINKVLLYNQQQPQTSTIVFLTRMMKIVGMRPPQGLLDMFAVNLRKDDETKENIDRVIEFLVCQSRDHETLLDEFYKTFRRKKLVWLFALVTCKIFKTLHGFSKKIQFFDRVVRVMIYLQQQQNFLSNDDLLALLECIVSQFWHQREQPKLQNEQLALFKSSVLKIWFLLALSHLDQEKCFQPVLVKLAAITPVIVYDAEFSEWVRSNAKSTELELFTENVFDKLQQQVLLKSQKHTYWFDLSNAQSTQKVLEKVERPISESSDHIVEDLEDIEVGFKLMLVERVFVAWLCQILRLKIQAEHPRHDEFTFGASFVEQIISVFGTDANFNVIVTSSTNEQITTAKMQQINTPFGKQLDFLSKTLINQHLDAFNVNYSRDFSFILMHVCSDSWCTRMIATQMIQAYQYKSPCLSLQILSTYVKLLNSCQEVLSQSYNSLSHVCLIDNVSISMPDDHDLLVKIQEELVRTLTNQYLASCILGNRSQVDFTINELVNGASLSQCQANHGQRCVQSLLQLQVQLPPQLNVNQLLRAYNQDLKSFSRHMYQVYLKVKTQSGFFMISPVQKQIKLPLVKAHQDIEVSRLELSLQSHKPKDYSLSISFDELILQACELVRSLQVVSKLEALSAKKVKRAQLYELLQETFLAALPDVATTKHNSLLNNLSQAKAHWSDSLQQLVTVLTRLQSTEIQVTQLVQIIGDRAEMMLQYLMFLQAHRPHQVSVAVRSLEACALKQTIPAESEWSKEVDKYRNPVKKSIQNQVNMPHSLLSRQKPLRIIEQLNDSFLFDFDIAWYLKRLGYNVMPVLKTFVMPKRIKDLYTALLYVKLMLETQQKSFVADLCLRVLGRQFKSDQLQQVYQWVQLIEDIKALISKDETVLQYLLSHFKWVLISWNFQGQITQSVQDFVPPLLSSKQAKAFVEKWPKLAVKAAETGNLNPKFIDSYKEALRDYIQANPDAFLHKSSCLEYYMKARDRSKFLCNVWASEDLIHMLKALSMRNPADSLEYQLAMKALEVSDAKTVIFFLPQLFQSLRNDKKQGNLIADFLVRKSLQYVSVAHNVLWFCKVESVLPDEKEQHNRKVPLPVRQENLHLITQDLYRIIMQKLGQREQKFFETETNFFEKITSISGLLSTELSKDQKKALIKEKLIEYHKDIPECVYLPTNQNCRVVDIVTTSGMPMQSAARVPILISFEVEDYSGPDQDTILERTGFLQGLLSGSLIQFDQDQSQSITRNLSKFKLYWVPIISEEDIEDEEFDVGTHEAHIDEKTYDMIPTNQTTMLQTIVTRQLQVKKSMFSYSPAWERLKPQMTSMVQMRINEEDQLNFMKKIKQVAFKAQYETQARGSESMSIMKNFIQGNSMISTPTLQKQASTIRRISNFDQKQFQEMIIAQTQEQQNAPQPVTVVSCIFKTDDDLRQDILALQFIKHFQKIFKKNNLDLYVAPYRCISNRTGSKNTLGGIIEVVANSHSRDQLGKAFEINLHEYFLKRYGAESTSEFKFARYNFIRSLAAYAVVSFILQIKDRHNGNILIDENGHLIHIDFGFIFDWSPGKDMRFESAAFKLTQEFIDILGGSTNTLAFQLFESMVIQGYLAVREHSEHFMNLTELMLYSGFPCFKPFSLQNLEQRFRRDLSQAEAAIWMRTLVQDAANKWTTRVYDLIQYKTNKIVF